MVCYFGICSGLNNYHGFFLKIYIAIQKIYIYIKQVSCHLAPCLAVYLAVYYYILLVVSKYYLAMAYCIGNLGNFIGGFSVFKNGKIDGKLFRQ